MPERLEGTPTWTSQPARALDWFPLSWACHMKPVLRLWALLSLSLLLRWPTQLQNRLQCVRVARYEAVVEARARWLVPRRSSPVGRCCQHFSNSRVVCLQDYDAISSVYRYTHVQQMEGILQQNTYGAIFEPVYLESASFFSDRKRRSSCLCSSPHPSTMRRAGQTCVFLPTRTSSRGEPPLTSTPLGVNSYKVVILRKMNRSSRGA